MKINKKKNIKYIEAIYSKAKGSKLSKVFFTKIEKEVAWLSKYFDLEENQTVFISLLFSLSFMKRSVSLNDIADHLHSTPLKLLQYSDDIDVLHKKGFLKKEKEFQYDDSGSRYIDSFVINELIIESVVRGIELPKLVKEAEKTILNFLEKLHNLVDKREENEMNIFIFEIEAHQLMCEGRDFPLIQRIEKMRLYIIDKLLFLELIWNTVIGNEYSEARELLEKFYDSKIKKLEILSSFISGEHFLVKNDFIEIIEANFFNDAEMKLTEKSLHLLKECGIDILSKKKINKDTLIHPDTTPERKLIFSDEINKNLKIIEDVLENEKFQMMQSRLEEKGLTKGITVLFHGVPGTGKTEIVKQIAKKTNREIFKVDISQSKSMWFGESEKIIKKIFTNYKDYTKNCKIMPILFFNEADAIISVRKQLNESNVAQTENTMQNIILEEMENFEGILFATTNLVSNLDKAFERRFLFKVRFEKPTSFIQEEIWKLKLKGLQQKEYEELADKFDFSGGQIDNILSKSEIFEIVHGSLPDFAQLLSFCEDESLIPERGKIGFEKK